MMTATSGCFDPGDVNDTAEGTTGGAEGSGTMVVTTATMSGATTESGATTDTGSTTTDPDTTASLDDGTTAGETGSETTEDTTDGGMTTCADAGGVCLSAPAKGWSQPFARGETADDCGGSFDVVGSEWFVGVAADVGSCDCTCGEPMGTCDDARRGNYFQQGCPGTKAGSADWDPGVCQFDGPYNPQAINSRSVIAADVDEESCAGTIEEDLPEPELQGAVVGCGLADELSGECPAPTDLCIPEPGEPLAAGLCVSQAGEHACPEGYPEQTVLLDTVVDGRMCDETCECTVTSSFCTTNWSVFSADDCSGAPLSNEVLESGLVVCATPPSGSPARYSELTSVDYVGEGCNAPPSVPATGEVSGVDPVTVCCTE